MDCLIQSKVPTEDKAEFRMDHSISYTVHCCAFCREILSQAGKRSQAWN